MKGNNYRSTQCKCIVITVQADVPCKYLVVGSACPLAETCCVRSGVGLPVWRSAGRGDAQMDLGRSQ